LSGFFSSDHSGRGSITIFLFLVLRKMPATSRITVTNEIIKNDILKRGISEAKETVEISFAG
jgi:hypothetical protein